MEPLEVVISSMISGLVGLGLGLFFRRLNRKNDKKRDELLGTIRGEITDLNIGINKKFLEFSEKEGKIQTQFELIKNQTVVKFVEDDNYKEREKICIELLDDLKWLYRTENTLMKKSKMDSKEFKYFVQNNDDVQESTLPDIYGNRLFYLKSRKHE